ncbi:L-histidine N(alpha)-methyltransferase [Acidihalobacter ferrooxydans]|uniref:L-histidine N(Alpha)-methyltransferase n=1 Tax=Acidihalobacter ferrooxydans TaxID=1765967 RepID=A0A1P8UG34_9GAMM|nr:L-histidine N(alpha)-methyltransferase [Acidihalobacter ferrooxydans]APZ42724.1 L-histidine N(alpha)-methyltransferase [Acidihalobacter ferrooxydans]
MPFDPTPEFMSIICDLNRNPARIDPKYFYDDHGSALFEQITRLPEYYLTRTELTILDKYGSQINHVIGQGVSLIELGAGNCEKSRALCKHIRPVHFVAIDVAEEFVSEGVRSLESLHPRLVCHAVAADLAKPIELPAGIPSSKRIVFYPGSSIGNFDPESSRALLERCHALLGAEDWLLLGVDLVKDPEILEAAYNDKKGVTAQFNKNVLIHINRLIGSDFDPDQWRHVAFYNAVDSRMEMHLEAKSDTVVSWPSGKRKFHMGEGIHTENSYKFTLKTLKDRLRQAGFQHTNVWMDEHQWYALTLSRA